jgi:predicted HTH domain antitoxin
MAVSFELPKKVEDDLRGELGDLNRAAKEALLIECYRQARISIGYLAQALDMGVLEADEWLRKRGVPLNYTPEDLKSDIETLERILPRTGR